MNSAGKVAILLDYWTDPGFQFHVAEEAKDRTVVFERSSFVPVEAASPELIASHKRKRKPSMADAARLAAREGVEVRIAPDGTITATPVKPLDIAPTINTATGNEWDRLQ